MIRNYANFDTGAPIAGAGVNRWTDLLVIVPDDYDSARREPYPWHLELHGAGASARYYDATSDEGMYNGPPVAAHYIDLGYVFVVAFQGEPGGESNSVNGRPWGSDTAIAGAMTSYQYALDHYNLEMQPTLGGQSAGGVTSAMLVKLFPTYWRGVALMHPVLDQVTTYNGPTGLWGSQNYAYKIPTSPRSISNFKAASGFGTAGTHHPQEPSFRAAIAAAGVKIWSWHGTSDGVVPYSQSVDEKNAINAMAPGLMGVTLVANGNHDSVTMNGYLAGIDAFLATLPQSSVVPTPTMDFWTIRRLVEGRAAVQASRRLVSFFSLFPSSRALVNRLTDLPAVRVLAEMRRTFAASRFIWNTQSPDSAGPYAAEDVTSEHGATASDSEAFGATDAGTDYGVVEGPW